MMKLIADSSANLTMLEGVTYQSVPMTIRAGERDFVDDETLDTHELLDYLAAYNGKSGTACPSLDGWLKAFEGADEIFVITITSSLSGTCASAMAARDVYLQSHPEVKIRIFDTLSTGPEMQLLAEKLAELHAKGLPFDVICEKAQEYLATTHLFFSLKSLHNLAQNGRVSKIAAGAIGILGIQILATASLEGTIQPVEKCRGEKKRARRWYRSFWNLTTTAARCASTTPKIQRRLGRSPLRCAGTFPKQTLRSVPAVVFAATMPSAAA